MSSKDEEMADTPLTTGLMEHARLIAERDDLNAKIKVVEEARAALPPISDDEVRKVFESAMAVVSDKGSTPKRRHDAASGALLLLEQGKYSGREIDILAQIVIDHRED